MAQDPLAALNARLNNLGRIGPPRRRRSSSGGGSSAPLSPAEEESVLGTLGRKALGGLGIVGNILDTPGAFTRNALAGENPFRALLHPITGEGRVGGRELLTKYGITKPNDPNKWEWSDLGGGLAEMALDPTAYLTFGASALAKGGAKGIARVGIPFTKVGVNVGTGRIGQAIGRGAGRVKNAAMYGNIPFTQYSPGRHLSRAFDSDVMQAVTGTAQRAARARASSADAAQAAVKMKVADWATQFNKAHEAGLIDAHDSRTLRRMLEKPETAPAELMPTINSIHQHLRSIRPQYLARGMKAPALDDVVEYIPRFLSSVDKDALRSGGGSSRVFAAVEPSQKARKMFLKGMVAGTDPIIRLGQDPKLNALIDAGAGKIKIARYISKNYPDIPQAYSRRLKPGEFGPPKPRSRVRALAEWMKSELSKETRTSGIFGNTPLLDIQNRSLRAADRLHAVDTAFDFLSRDVTHLPRRPLKGEGMVPLHRVFQALQLNRGTIADGGWIRQVANRNPEIAAAILRAVHTGPKSKAASRLNKISRELYVPKELARDALRVRPRKIDETTGGLMAFADPLINVFKAGVTGVRPAFHSRNFGSGQAKNLTEGLTPLHRIVGAGRKAADLLGGKAVKGVENIQEIRDILAKRNMPVTPENAQDVLRQLAYAHDLSQTHLGEAGQIVGAGPSGSTFRDVLAQLPGLNGGVHLRDAARQALGRAASSTWNPFKAKIRGGFGGAAESTFAPIVAGETVGKKVEGLNRLAPFIDQLERGVPSAEAARRIKSAQVDYASRKYTPFERNVMTRLFPFYKFTKGSTTHLAQELAQRPGGPTAQIIRATNRARGNEAQPPVPDYIGETAAVPFGRQADGSLRFLTGLGLMHEAPLEMLGGNPLLEAVSRSNPLIKAPLELAFGQSAFQKGSDGGRPLSDMDPVVGRLLANIVGRDEPVRVNPVLEHALANSPLSGALTSLKTLTGRRESDTALKKLLNLGTGLRITDISPTTQDTELRRRVDQALKELGGRSFEKVYIPQTRLGNLNQRDLMFANQLQRAKLMIDKRAKGRKKKRPPARPLIVQG